MAEASFMIETEKVLSLFKIADSIGEAPLYLGRSEGCMLRIPSGSNKFKISSFIMIPNEAKMP